MTRARVRLAAIGLVVAVVGLAALSPLRDISGDTTPGHLGALVLRCAGSFDLARVDFIRGELEQKRTYYFLHYDTAEELTSVFGPAPAVVGAVALMDVGPGDSITDESLRVRERIAAALLVGVSALLLFLAALGQAKTAASPLSQHGTLAGNVAPGSMDSGASSWPRHSSGRALMTAAVAALSFAGIATLGQGLWQATIALPLLAGALAMLAWRDRHARLAPAASDPASTNAKPTSSDASRAPLLAGRDRYVRMELATPTTRAGGTRHGRIALATPALLAVAVMLRPTIAPLVLGLGVAWAREARNRRTWVIAGALALVAIAPLVAWNAIHLNSPLPLGQLHSNQRMTSSVFSLGGAGVGLAGLLVSPARGLLWFAPIAIVGVIVGLRDPRWRPVAAGVVLQLVAMALFFKWHGGQAFGPRLLAEATWVATFLALAVPTWSSRRARAGIGIAIAVTCVVGQLGLWLWHPTQWETRRLPDSHPAALWDVADSPLTSLSRTATATPSDVPPRSHFVCGSTITSN